MRSEAILRVDSRIIEIDAVDGILAESLRAAGYAKHLTVVRDERRQRAISDARPDLSEHIAVSAHRRVVRQNNADVLILHGWSALFAWRWRDIRHARLVALPWTASPLCWFAVLIWLYQWSLGRLAWPVVVRPTRVANLTCGRRNEATTLLVSRVRRPRPYGGARRFIPHAQGIEGFLHCLHASGVRHAVLRWFEHLPQLPAGEDIDSLVDDESLDAVHAMLDAAPGIQPIDVYSVTGLPGADFRAMPYFPPYLAEQLLDAPCASVNFVVCRRRANTFSALHIMRFITKALHREFRHAFDDVADLSRITIIRTSFRGLRGNLKSTFQLHWRISTPILTRRAGGRRMTCSFACRAAIAGFAHCSAGRKKVRQPTIVWRFFSFARRHCAGEELTGQRD